MQNLISLAQPKHRTQLSRSQSQGLLAAGLTSRGYYKGKQNGSSNPQVQFTSVFLDLSKVSGNLM